MEDTNLGSMSANVQLTADTSDVERAITEMTSKAKSQFDKLGGETITSLTQQFNGLTSAVTGGLDTINAGIAKIRNIAGLGFLGAGISSIVGQIYQTRQFFQDTESTMTTFFKSADKSKEFVAELKDYAYYNMYEFSDLVTVSKQLIAYGTTETKDIIRVTDQLSNIATGTGANINEMVGIYNKIKATGKANGLVLQQLASRGLVVKDVLKEMGEAVNGNTITFKQFEKVLQHVTDEGGMFHNQMANQMDNLSASYGQLQDNLTAMFAEMGEELEPVFKDAIDFAGMLVDNYREIAAVLFDLVKAYGVYKVVANFREWNKQSKEEERVNRLKEEKDTLDEALESTKALKNEDLQAEVAKKKLTQAEADEIALLREQVEAENKMRIEKKQLTDEQAKELAIVKEGLLRREQELKQVKAQADAEVAAIEKEIAAIEKKHAVQQEEVNVAKSFGAEGKSILETEQKRLNNLETQKQQLESKKLVAQKRAEEAALQQSAIATARETAAKVANTQTNGVLSRALTATRSAIRGIENGLASMINPAGLAMTAFGLLGQEMYEVYKTGSLLQQQESRLAEAQDEADKEMVEKMQNLAQYATTIKLLTKPSEDYAKQLKKLKENTVEYNETAEKSKIVNAQLGEAKKGLAAMSKELNISTTETVNGLTKEMSAIDLVTKKYDEYKQKIQDVANFKAYQNYVEAEKKNMQEAISDFTSYLREDMVDVLLKGVKGTARGEKIAEINAALAEYEISILETGKAPLGGKYKEIYDQYIEEIKKQDTTVVGSLKNVGKGFKRLYQEAKDALGGDLTWTEWWENMQQSMADYAAGYVGYLEQRTENMVAIGNSALSNARRIFKVTEDPLAKEEEERKKQNANKYKTNIKNEKDNQNKYIQDYAKLAEERYKALKKIDDDYSLDKEVKVFKKQKINAEFDFKVDKIDKSKLTDQEVEELNSLYNNSLDAANKMALEDADKKMKELRANIEEKEKEREKILTTERITDEEGNDLTADQKKKEKEARTKKANEISADIAKLNAQMLAYENIVKRQFDETDFTKKADAYAKFAKEYTATLIAEQAKEVEINEKKKELERQALEATDANSLADIQRQKSNADKELEVFRAEQETKRKILVEGFDGTATDITDIINKLMVEASNTEFTALQDAIVKETANLRKLKARQQMGEDVSQEIAEVTANLEILQGTAEAVKKAMQVKKGDNALEFWNNSKKAIGQLTDSFDELGNAIGGATKEALETANLILNTTVSLVDNIVTFTTTSIEAIKTAESAGAKAVKTVEAASVILAVLSAVIQLGHMVANMFNKKDPVDELRDSLHDFNRELEETKRLADQELTFKPFNTIFGSDQWGTMLNNLRLGQEALIKYNETVDETIAKADTMSEEMGNHGRARNSNWFTGRVSISTAQNQYGNIEDTVSNMYIKLQHKTWFRDEKGTTLGEMVPSLFDKDGKLDKNALHEFVEAGNDAFQKLSTENQDYLKDMDAAWQEYQESVQQVKDTFSDFFGNLGSEIQDVWTNAFRTGQDGLADFEKSWDSAIENMITSMAYNKTIGKLMSQMEDDLDSSGFFENPEGNMAAAIDIMESYEEKSRNTQAAYDAILQEYRDRGYFQDESAAEERKAVSGGITNMTQDTAEELNGRMTQIQSHTFGILENQKLMVSMQTTQLTILQGIHSDTVGIRSDIAELKATVSDIQIKGLKMK